MNALGRVAQPLLKVLTHLTGFETSFVTLVDWVSQQQEVAFAHNEGELQIPPKARIPWQDSLCRQVILRELTSSADVPGDFPQAQGPIDLGIRSFLGLPVILEGRAIGTLCAASSRSLAVSPEAEETARLLAEALATQLHAVRESWLTTRSSVSPFTGQIVAAQDSPGRPAWDMPSALDPITTLDGRAAFEARLEEALVVAAADRSSHLGVALATIDGLPSLAADRGDHAAARVLKTAVASMRYTLPGACTIARLTADQLGAVVPGVGESEMTVLTTRLRETFAQACAAAGLPAQLSVSVLTTEKTPRIGLYEAVRALPPHR